MNINILIKIVLFAVPMCILSSISSAQVNNGGFENWSAAKPDAWTTIDSGISVLESRDVKMAGTRSAQITVNTSTQSSTDLRQSVNVRAGERYEFSVSVFHTEGGVRARLYVDGYRNYSSESVTDQWQRISYSYTPSSDGVIEVGLRFYDTAAFDGSEHVYIDDFQPSQPPNPGQCSDVDLRLVTDNYGSETSWQISDSEEEIVFSGGGYASNRTYEGTLCLDPGEYTFSIFDSFGDGICCRYGSGSYRLSRNEQIIASGGVFGRSDNKRFIISDGPNLGEYYRDAQGLSGYALKTALHQIINDHNNQGYGALWTFYRNNELDRYYENDGSILDIYSERPAGNDAQSFVRVSDQCGSFRSEGDCYNREHSFPRSWFGGSVEPMNSDVHHIFASDGFVNSKRSSYPYGNVGNADFVSSNGSRQGSPRAGSGYSGPVFEPIDEFKGDVARAQFYVATRYEDQVRFWEGNSSRSDAVLDGSSSQVFEAWYLALLKQWHQLDPVSQKERERNEAALNYQGNRNPFIDHPEFVEMIWGN